MHLLILHIQLYLYHLWYFTGVFGPVILVAMSESLGDLLAKRDFDEPPEARAIKEYVRRYYDTDVKVTMQQHAIVISARSAALIGSLRMHLPKLQAAAQTDKRLLLRIG
jgi:hypothetical protein